MDQIVRRPPIVAILLAVVALPLITAAGPPADAAARVDHEVALTVGEDAAVDGGAVAGVNYAHLGGTDETYPCGDDPAMMCRTILVELTNPFDADADRGRERATLSLALHGDGVGDAAIMVYASDVEGKRGDQVGGQDELGTLADEATTVSITTTPDQETVHVLVEVFFHAWAGTWSMDLAFS